MKEMKEIKAITRHPQIVLTSLKTSKDDSAPTPVETIADASVATETTATTGGAASTGATGTSATAGASASTGTPTPAGTAATSSTSSWKTKLKIWFKKFDRITTKVARMLGKLFWAMLIAYVIGHFCPELREKIPAFYQFVDGSLDCFDYIWKIIIEVIKWYVHFVTFGHVTL